MTEGSKKGRNSGCGVGERDPSISGMGLRSEGRYGSFQGFVPLYTGNCTETHGLLKAKRSFIKKQVSGWVGGYRGVPRHHFLAPGRSEGRRGGSEISSDI